MPPIRLNTRLTFRDREYRVYTAWDADRGVTRSDVFGSGQKLYSRVTQANGSPEISNGAFERAKSLHTRVAGDLDRLFKLGERAKNSHELQLHNYVGELFAGRRMWMEARDQFECALQIDHGCDSALFNVGRVYSALGLHEQAIEHFARAVECRPDYPDYHNVLGEAYLSARRCRDAASSFRTAARLNPYYWLPHYNLGLTYIVNHRDHEDFRMNLDFETKAMESLEHARSLRPEIDGLEYDGAAALLGKGDIEEALARFTRIKSQLVEFDLPLEVSPFEIWRRVPFVEPSERELAEAIADLRVSINDNPDWADLHYALAQAYAYLAQTVFGKAVVSLQRALEINPGFRRARRNLRLAENELKGLDLLVKAMLDAGMTRTETPHNTETIVSVADEMGQ